MLIINKLLLLSVAIGLTLNSLSQNILLNIPVDPHNPFGDISDYKNEVAHSYLAPTFKQNKSKDDSSALYLGVRQFLEIDPTPIIEFQEGYLTLSINLKFENEPFDKNKLVMLFGQSDNIGLMFDHENMTLFDVEELFSYKLENLDSWFNIKLSYFKDSTVQLLVNDSIVQTAKRTSNNLLNNSTLGIGKFYDDYAYASIDSIQIKTGFKKTNSLLKKVKENIFVYPNPVKSKIFVKTNSKKGLNLELFDVDGKLLTTKKSNNLNVEGIKPGVYLLKINYENINVTERIIKK